MPRFTAGDALRRSAGSAQRRILDGGGNAGVYPSDVVFRGCYYGTTSYYDCDIAGFYGVYYGYWNFYICDNRYCPGGFGLVTGP